MSVMYTCSHAPPPTSKKKDLVLTLRRLCSENTVHLSEFGCFKQLLETVMMRTLRLNHTANGPQNDEIKQDEQQTTPRKDSRVALYYEPFSLCTCNDRPGNLRSYYKVISSSTSSGAESWSIGIISGSLERVTEMLSFRITEGSFQLSPHP